MYKSKLALSDPWRHFIAEAPTIEIEALIGRETYIPLDQLLVQGAVDLDSFSDELQLQQLSPLPEYTNDDPPEKIKGRYSLADKPAQRGWALTFNVAANKTAKGRASLDSWRQGIVYKNTVGQPGDEDCVTYFLSNGTQQSDYGQIKVTLIRGYDLDFNITYDADKNRFWIKTSKYTPPDYPYHWFRISWYKVGPYVEYNDYTKRNEIRRGRQYIIESKWRVPPGSMSRYLSYTIRAEDIKIVPEDDTALAGVHDPKTNAPYVPTGKPFEIEIDYTVWPYHSGIRNYPDWSTSIVNTFDLSTKLGTKWYEYKIGVNEADES